MTLHSSMKKNLHFARIAVPAWLSACLLAFLLPAVWSETAPAPAPAAGQPAADQDKEIRLLYDTARRLYRERKYYAARHSFSQIREVRPDYRCVPQYLAAIDRKLGGQTDDESAAPSASQLKAWYQEGVALFKKEQFAEARDRFRSVIEVDPGYSSAEDYLAKAETALSGPAQPEAAPGGETAGPGAPEGASDAAPERSEQQEKELSELLDGAYLLEKSGQPAQAKAMVEKALQIDPKNRRGLRQLARLEAEAAKAAVQKPMAGTASRKTGDRAAAARLEKRADELYRQGALEEARGLYEEILKNQPDNAIAQAMIRVIDRRRGGGDAAAGRIEARARRALLEKAQDAYRRGEHEAARDLLSALILDNPGDQEARDLLNRVELSTAKKEQKAQARDQKNKEHEEVKDEVRRIRELRDLIHLGKFEDVAQQSENLLKERPDWPEVQGIRELAYHAMETNREKRADIEGEISDRRALSKTEETSVIPEEPSPILRPQPGSQPSSPDLTAMEEKLQQKVSVNLVEADLSYVLDLLFRATGVNIVANPEMIGQKQITVHVEQIPLQDLLEYISRNYGILFSVNPSAVWVSTPEQPFLETQIRHLNKGLTDVAEAAESTTSDVEKLLERLPELIDWPQGSQYYVDRKKNVLFLRSTPEALAKANELVNAVDESPLQILIETRFIELEADQFKDLDVDFSLTSDFAVLRKRGGNKVQIDAGTGTELGGGVGDIRPSDDPAPNADPNSEGLDLTLSGVLTDPQFQLVIKALQDSKKAKTLAAPRILAMNNYTSEIEITQSLIYIENYEVDRADISGTTVGAVPGQQIPGTGELSSEPIIIPQFAEGEEIGFRLKVTPSVGLDHRQITLVLEPEITEQVDEITFNLIIPDFEGDAPITRPIISKRVFTTKVTVDDGSVLALAGLMRHRKGKRLTKIPVLGDIPYLRVLFRREGDFDIKTNLLIFVKATLLDGQGRRYIDAGSEASDAPDAAAPQPIGEE